MRYAVCNKPNPCPSVVGFIFEDEDEDDSVINHPQWQPVLKVREIAGS
jgi:hypothetical protein